MSLLIALEIVAAGQTFACTPAQIGGGVRIACAEGPRIALAAIAVRDAQAARDHLVRLVGRPLGAGRDGGVRVRAVRLMCRSDGAAADGRTAAWCLRPDGVDLSCEMAESGHAARLERHWRPHRCADYPDMGGERIMD